MFLNFPYTGKRTLFSVAEEVFDMTNNPSRYSEAEAFAAKGSDVFALSTTDVVCVEVDNKTIGFALCLSSGWRKATDDEVKDRLDCALEGVERFKRFHS